jgi:pimeloyl-ACP methyl ester carboxylesterase
LPTTFALIPGAGGSAWYWHRVTPLLSAKGCQPVAIDLPAADDSADLHTYADVVSEAVEGVAEPLVLVAQSMGAFTAPLVASRVATAQIVLVNPMVPSAGETPGQWWAATGHDRAVPAFDPVEDFFHDVEEPVRAEAFSQPEPQQSDTPFGQVWPLDRWPDIPTRVIVGSEDRLFPLDFQRQVVRDRLGLEVEVMPGGHLMALSQPQELASRLLAGVSLE